MGLHNGTARQLVLLFALHTVRMVPRVMRLRHTVRLQEVLVYDTAVVLAVHHTMTVLCLN